MTFPLFLKSIGGRWRNSSATRNTLFGFARLLDEALVPFQLLKKGHIFLLLYTLGISALAVWSALEINQHWFNLLIQTKTQTGLSLLVISRIWLCSGILIWICSLPFFYTAIGLPLRILWMRGTLAMPELLSKTVPSIRFSLQALGLALKIEFYTLIPLLAMASRGIRV